MSDTEHDQAEPDETTTAEPDETDDDDDAAGDDETDETDETDAPEPAPEPESQAVMEEIGKKLEALTKTVATRISTILGDQALDFEVCDLCSYWGTPGWRHSGQLPADLTEHLLHLLNQRAPGDYRVDPHSRQCETCGGEGVVDTRSKVPGQNLLPCVECNANGWIATDDERRPKLLSLANGPTFTPGAAAPADAAMTPTPPAEPPQVAELRAQGYVIVPPITMAQ